MQSWYAELDDEPTMSTAVQDPRDQALWDFFDNQAVLSGISASDQEHAHEDTAQPQTSEDDLSRALEEMELDGTHDSMGSRSYSTPSNGNLSVTDLGFTPIEELHEDFSTLQNSTTTDLPGPAHHSILRSIFGTQPSRMALVNCLPPLERHRRSRISSDLSMNTIAEVDSIRSQESNIPPEAETSASPTSPEDAYVVTLGIGPEAMAAGHHTDTATTALPEVESSTGTVRRRPNSYTPVQNTWSLTPSLPPDTFETRVLRPRRMRGPRPQPQISNPSRPPATYGNFANDGYAVGVSFEENIDQSTLEVRFSKQLSMYEGIRIHLGCIVCPCVHLGLKPIESNSFLLQTQRY